MKEIRVYFEGDPKLKPGFRAFFAKGGFTVRTIATKARPDQVFEKAVASHPDVLNILLRDSEGPVVPERPSVFWMVQKMESWFLADQDTLEKYYGQGFQLSALKKNKNVEQIPNADIQPCLSAATKDTKKGRHKTQHARRFWSGLTRSWCGTSLLIATGYS